MILVPLVLIVVVGALVLTGALSFDWRALLVVPVLLLAVAAVGLVGVGISRTSGGDEEDEPTTPAPAEVAKATEPSSPGFVWRRVDVVIGTGEVLEGEFAAPATVVDELPDRSTQLVGFDGERADLVQQCVVDPEGEPRSCGAATPVGSADGRAAGLVELLRLLPTTTGTVVDCGVERCALVALARHDGGVLVGSAQLVFGGPAPAPALRVDGARALREGDSVRVVVDGLAPGEHVTIGWCAPPGPVEPSACGAPAPIVDATAGDDGRIGVRLGVPDGEVGARRAGCGPRQPCAVAVLGASVPVAPVKAAFAGVDGPDLPAGRVAAGLAVAAALGVVAFFLMRRRPMERPADPFVGVSLDVPEWEGIDLSVPTDAEAAITSS